MELTTILTHIENYIKHVNDTSGGQMAGECPAICLGVSKGLRVQPLSWGTERSSSISAKVNNSFL